MRRSIQLILFFDIYNTIKLMKSCPIDIESLMEGGRHSATGGVGGEMAVTMEREVQTELHPVPFHKDENYVWNVWELRRKAIELANLRRKKTSSAQTPLTYHRLSIASQRLENRQNDSQTSESKESNTD